MLTCEIKHWSFLLTCSLSLPIFPLAAFLVEKMAQKKYMTEHVSQNNLFVLHFLFLIILPYQLNVTAQTWTSHSVQEGIHQNNSGSHDLSELVLPFIVWLYVQPVTFLTDPAGSCHSSHNYNDSFHFVSSSGHPQVCSHTRSWNFDIYILLRSC